MAMVPFPSRKEVTVVASDDAPEDFDALQGAAQDLIDAVQAGDAGGVKDALQAAFTLMELEPHEEAEVES